MSVWCILLAGGSGERMGATVNKTLLSIAGEPGLCRALRTLRRHCDGVALAVRAGDEEAVAAALGSAGLAADIMAPGGADRQQSVFNCLQKLPDDCDIVLVHDGARPLADDATVLRVIASAREYGSGVAALPVRDTVKRVDGDNIVLDTLNREELRIIQTPQGFSRSLLMRAHALAAARYTDDAALVEALGGRVRLVEGSAANIKLTTKADVALARAYAAGTPRAGHGFDAHRLVPGRPLILGGVAVPYERGLLGHSDADVLAHAVMDALLGAAALGDIGRHFPDSDAAYQGADSLILLRKTLEILEKAGFAPRNIDATVICQRPKLSPYMDAMRQNIAAALRLPPGSVSVKATTTEGMGFEGAGEGISCHAVAIVMERTL